MRKSNFSSKVDREGLTESITTGTSALLDIPNSSTPTAPLKRSRTHRSSTTTMWLVWILVGGFLLTTVASQLHTFLSNPIVTETAQLYTGNDTVLFKGVYIRDERQVHSEAFGEISRTGNGVISFTNRCGAKLSNNSVIAVVYESEGEKYNRQRITELSRRIEVLVDAEDFVSGGDSEGAIGAQIEAFSGQMSDVHSRMLRSIATAQYDRVSVYASQYLGLQTKINLLRGSVSIEQISSRIAEYKNQVTALESRLSGVLQELRSNEAGYFVGNADGYESVLNMGDALTLTRERIEEIIKNPINPSLPVADNVVGRMIDDYRWRMAAVIPTNRVRGIATDHTVQLRVGSFSRSVPARVVRSEDQGDGYTVFVFESEVLNEEFVRQRVASVRLMLGTYHGIRLPQSAVTFNDDGERGVFVRSGFILHFRRINMLRSNENFVIIEESDETPGFLRLFDDVVVEGVNLYDGKVVLWT
ncbi:MAG: hypothetical protein FWF76_06585 [Oscillospiraceae bacterium]|nr:hypothetical protein [Oscillospiraceae bacterium]